MFEIWQIQEEILESSQASFADHEGQKIAKKQKKNGMSTSVKILLDDPGRVHLFVVMFLLKELISTTPPFPPPPPTNQFCCSSSSSDGDPQSNDQHTHLHLDQPSPKGF
jgi:hypothetical protein